MIVLLVMELFGLFGVVVYGWLHPGRGRTREERSMKRRWRHFRHHRSRGVGLDAAYVRAARKGVSRKPRA